MFENTTNNQQPVEDIFSQVTSEPSVVNNKISPLKPLNESMPAMGVESMPIEEDSIWQGKWLIVVVVVLALAVVAMLGVWFWKKSSNAVPVKTAEVVSIVNNNQPEANADIPNTNVPSVDNTTLDTDSDGLTDAQERTLGTDINNADTDNDGLFDGEEYKIYKTDPLNLDTDGDTFSDGIEVHNGYNPKGSGKLLELPNNK